MRDIKAPTTSPTSHRKGERGSALVVALLCMVALFAITIAATSIRVANARDVEDRNAQAIQYWQARSAAANIQASLVVDIPRAFDADLQRAQIAANGYPLPAFDQPNIAAQYSLPVMNADGSITSRPASQCTSLLGNLDAWAARKTSLVETYAANRGFGSDKARVAVLREYQRQQLVGVGGSEPAYVLQYMIDAAVGESGNVRGRVRPSGTIMLGPSQPACNTTVALAANPSSISLGNSTTLTVTYTNANHVWLVDQNGTVVPGTDTTGLTETNAAQTINFTVSPTDDTSYRALGQGSSGCQAISAFVAVTVTYPPPLILSFDASPTCINRGDTATLNFQVQYATTITITGGGVNQSFPGNAGSIPTSGSLTVTPTVDTTYTLTATGRGGTASRTVSVLVKQPITINSFTSDTYCLTPPANSVNLTWSLTNAETATITDNSTEITTGVSATGGTRSFPVNGPTTFTLTANRTGCDGTPDVTTQTISINTNAVPTASFSANPTTIQIGSTTLLQWATTNTTDNSAVTISASPAGGSGLPTPQTVTPNGTLRIQPTAVNTGSGYTYTLTVTNAGCNTQTVTRTATVFVTSTPPPPSCPDIQSFDGDSCIVSGNNATLRWNVANADFVDITGPGINRSFSANPVGTGSVTLAPTVDTTYTLTARTNNTGPQQVTWQAVFGAIASNNNLTKNRPDGWGDSGASSAQAIASGDGYVEFTASETNRYRMLGLSNGDSNQSYTDIDFALYPAADGILYIYESGTYRGAFGPYATGDLLRVSIEGGVVKYRRNGTLLYTSSIAPTYPLLVDTALYSNAATLTSVVISGNVQTTSTPSIVGLVAYWNLDEGSGMSGADGSGNSHTGYLLNGTTWTAGKIGSSALSFDGANNLFGINIDDAGLLNTFSYSFWAYPTQAHEIDTESTSGYAGWSGQRYLVSPAWYESGHVDSAISVGTNGVSVYTNGDSDFAPLLVYNAPITGWTQITVVWENKRPRLYINGTLVRTGLTSRQSVVHMTGNYIGGGFYGYYAGNVDDFRVYNRALSTTEIQTIVGSSGAGALSCTPASPPRPTTATFTVRVGQRPTITNLAAAPNAIDAGQSSRLTWNESSNLASVRVVGSGGDTNTYNVPPGQRYLDVRPWSSANYTVVVTSNDCSGQSANQTTTVTVAACPSITSPFRASPPTIMQGGSSTLSWGIANASQVLLNGSPVAPSGSLSVSPSPGTTTYTLTALSRNGTCNLTQTVTVTVTACPAPSITSFTATPSAVWIGGNQMVRLAWSINDSSGTGVTVTIAGVGTFAGASGFVDITQPQSTTTYTLTARNGCGNSATAQRTVTANACPAATINSFTATPSSVWIGGNAAVRLSWSVTDSSGTGVSISIPGVGTFAGPSGFVDIAQPQSTTTYTLNVTVGCGSVSSAQATVTANTCPAPTINFFDAAPANVTIGGGQTVRLSWDVTDSSGTGATVTIAGIGTYGPAGSVDIPQPQSTTTYTLTTSAGCGAQSSAQTTVVATACPAPNIQSFSASPSSVTIGGGQTVRLSWNVADPSGTGVTVTIAGIGTYGPSGFVDIPQPQSTTTYALTATAGCGASSSAQTTVTATSCPAPTIVTFSAVPNSVTIGGGQNIRLSWNVTDNSGTGVSVNIAGVGNFGPSGFVDIAQPQSTTTYTLTATAGCGAQDTAQTTVVANPPVASSLHIDLPFFVPSSPAQVYENPNNPSVSRFPGDYSVIASAGQVASANIQFGAYSPGIINTCYGTQTFVGDDGVPWRLSFVAADGTVMDSFPFERPSYSGATLTWRGTTPLPQAAAYITFTTTLYMNRYQANRETSECELVIDHAVRGSYIGTWNLSTSTWTNGGSIFE